ncbi:MAG: TonB family protein [Nitrospirae bacterium]|nr:TonB family protein [Nitrospirota bacterium]
MKHPVNNDSGDNSELLFRKILIIALIVYAVIVSGIMLIPFKAVMQKSPKAITTKPVEIHLQKTVPAQLSEEIKKRLAEEQKKREEEQKKLLEEKRLAEEKRKKEEQEKLAQDKKKAEEQRRLEEERRKVEEKKRKEEEKRKAAEQKKLEDEQRKAEEKRRRDDEKRLTDQKKKAEDEKKAVKEQNKAAAMNTGLLKAMKSGGGGRFADNVFDSNELNNAVSAPSLKGSSARSQGGASKGTGQPPAQGRTLKGSSGIGDVASVPMTKTGGLSGRRGDGGIDTKLAGKGDMGGGGKASPKTRSQGSIKEVLTSHRGSIDFIYRKALRDNPALKGTVIIEFTIAPSGEITLARIVSSTMHDQSFEQQVLKRIQTWKFPPFPESGSTVIKYPLEFEPA